MGTYSFCKFCGSEQKGENVYCGCDLLLSDIVKTHMIGTRILSIKQSSDYNYKLYFSISELGFVRHICAIDSKILTPVTKTEFDNCDNKNLFLYSVEYEDSSHVISDINNTVDSFYVNEEFIFNDLEYLLNKNSDKGKYFVLLSVKLENGTDVNFIHNFGTESNFLSENDNKFINLGFDDITSLQTEYIKINRRNISSKTVIECVDIYGDEISDEIIEKLKETNEKIKNKKYEQLEKYIKDIWRSD